MTKMNRIYFLAVAVLVALANSATAGTLSKSGGSVGVISIGRNNDLIGSVATTGLIDVVVGDVLGTYGANIGFAGLDPTDQLKFTFLGEEAGFNNSFQVLEFGASSYTNLFDNDSGGILDTTTDPAGLASKSFRASDFDLSEDVFRFGIDTTDTSLASTDVFVYNGSNPNDLTGGADQNFFVVDVSGKDAKGHERSGYLLWLDDGGASNDDDHDDMVVFVEVIENVSPPPGGSTNAAPEPSSMMMWAVIGLGCTGVRHRRRRKLVA